MKHFIITLICFLATQTIQAQKPTCGCRIKDGAYSLTVEGIVTYKGTSKALGHTYEVNLSFKNESKCTMTVENILVGTTDIKPNITLNIDAKNRKKSFKKTLQFKTLLEPSIGLDDALFADLLVSYKLNNLECSHEVTVAYEKANNK
jgi:hypothetical protein